LSRAGSDPARRFVTRGKYNPGLDAAPFHRKRHEAGEANHAASPRPGLRAGNRQLQRDPDTIVAQFDPIDNLSHAGPGVGFVLQPAAKDN
jgi:hypothetical protein